PCTPIRSTARPSCPNSRTPELSEFTHALRHPGDMLGAERLPLLERNPVAFWKGLCLILAIVIVILAFNR
ncbi:MAG: hypothetical protein ACTHKN_21390, partial [Achromobacter mucicolens]